MFIAPLSPTFPLRRSDMQHSAPLERFCFFGRLAINILLLRSKNRG
jgi:hypothetical protein